MKSFAQLFRPADFRAMPWKNGQGTTAEIAVEPPRASWESGNMLWRLSLASVSTEGDFSQFPGFDRFLTLASGAGLRLESEGATLQLRPGDVHHFAGEAKVKGSPLEGAVTDLSLIYRRGEINAEMNIFEITQRARSFRLDASTTFFFVISGVTQASAYPGEARYQLEKGMALRVSHRAGEAEKVILFEPGKENCQLAAVEIRL